MAGQDTSGRTVPTDDLRHIRSRRHPRGQRAELLRVRATHLGTARGPRFHVGTALPLHRHRHAGNPGDPAGAVRDSGTGRAAARRAERRLPGAGPHPDRGLPADAGARRAAARRGRSDGGGLRFLARRDRRGAVGHRAGRAADDGGLRRGGGARQARSGRVPGGGPPAGRRARRLRGRRGRGAWARAAHAAGMACVAVPYTPDIAGDPAFASAGLLFPGGHSEFSADAAYDWLAALRTA